MKNSKSLFALMANILMAITFNTLVGVAFALMLHIAPAIPVLTVNAIAFLPSIIQAVMPGNTPLSNTGLLYVGLGKEVYLSELLQQLRAAPEWLSRARDLSAYVQNDAINLAEAGADPNVIVDYDHVDPLPVADDEDAPISISLRSFSTERSKITDSQQDARAYAIMQDKMGRHAATIDEKKLYYSAYAFAPIENSAFTPVVETTGAGFNGFKLPKIKDILLLEQYFNEINATANKILVLDALHMRALKEEDLSLFKGFTPNDFKQGFPLYSFTAYVSNAVPKYYDNGGAPKIKVWNSAAENTDKRASFAFLENEVGRADGSLKVFKNSDDAAYQASFISARKRFLAVKMRNKYVGALVSKES